MTALAATAPLDLPGLAIVTAGLLLICGYGYLFDPARRDRARREKKTQRIEDLVAVARATGVIRVEHIECEAPGCTTALCLDDETCPGFPESACTHLNFLCGPCRLLECVDCRVDARHDAGVL